MTDHGTLSEGIYCRLCYDWCFESWDQDVERILEGEIGNGSWYVGISTTRQKSRLW
jgi:hypothetical protein